MPLIPDDPRAVTLRYPSQVFAVEGGIVAGVEPPRTVVFTGAVLARPVVVVAVFGSEWLAAMRRECIT